MFRKQFYFLALSLTAALTASSADYLNGSVTRVSDGDTVEVSSGADTVRVRFHGIDAPEKDQPWGGFAREYAIEVLLDEEVTVIISDRDQYGRVVGEIFSNGVSVNRLMVKEGLAWHYEFYSPEDRDLARLHEAAKERGIGLWSQENPQAPWDFRHNGPQEDENVSIGSEDVAGTIEPGKNGNELLNALRHRFASDPNEVGSYREARQDMFSYVDNYGGKVTLVYTGHEFATTAIPNHNYVNTEHTWPQSKFNGAHPMKSDLHHLFPTFNRVNGARSNHPFADIDDNRTEKWWVSETPKTQAPGALVRDDYSESAGARFEPREAQKGNTARAMFYFYMVYRGRNITPNWFTNQIPTLLRWHAEDPVDDRERERNERIQEVQGNLNPFILDSTLAERAYN